MQRDGTQNIKAALDELTPVFTTITHTMKYKSASNRSQLDADKVSIGGPDHRRTT